MSAYFQRLLQQTGVSVPTARQPIAPAIAPLPVFSAPRTTESDVLEISEEIISQPTAPSPRSTPATSAANAESSASQISNFKSASVPQSPSVRITAPVQGTHTTELIREETVVLERTSSAQAAATPPSPSAAPDTTSSAERANPTGQNPNPSSQPELPPDVMKAVMKWIAGGSNPPPALAQKAPVGAADLAAEARVIAAPNPSAPNSDPRSASAPKVPERVIQIVEEHFDTPPPRPPQLPPSPATTTPQSPVIDNTVSVSIGTIQLRVEAPPAPAAPARPSRTITAPNRTPQPPSAPKSTGLSRLRRHYILPH